MTLDLEQVPRRDAVQRFQDVGHIYEQAFPSEERADPLQVCGALGGGEKRLWTASRAGQAVAFAVCQELVAGAWLLEYLATAIDARSMGAGALLLQRLRRELAALEGRTLYLEVEPPETAPDDAWRQRRLAWYLRQGAIVAADFREYAMPNSLTGGAIPMTLLSMPILELMAPDGPTLCADVRAIFSRSYRTSHSHPVAMQVLNRLRCEG